MTSRQDSALLPQLFTYSPLSQEEVVDLWAKGCRETLLLHNLRLVVFTAKKWARYGVAFEDVFQYGVIGLMQAIQKYDPEKNDNFFAHATHWIRAAIRHGVRRDARTVRVPEYRWKERPAEPRYFAPPVEIDDPDCFFYNTYPDPTTAEDYLFETELKTTAMMALQKLRPKEKEIIIRHYGLGKEEPQTYAEIANALGMSRQGVQQAEVRAFQRLRRDPILRRRATT